MFGERGSRSHLPTGVRKYTWRESRAYDKAWLSGETDIEQDTVEVTDRSHKPGRKVRVFFLQLAAHSKTITCRVKSQQLGIDKIE